MPNKLVPHPETGKPVLEVVSYQDIEKSQLEADVTNKENELNQTAEVVTAKQAELDAATEAHTNAQAALEEAKSNVESYLAIEPQPETDAGTEEPGGENPDGNADGAVSVPVSVEEPNF